MLETFSDGSLKAGKLEQLPGEVSQLSTGNYW